ncbi:hypothetical protein ACFL2T_07535, partial [Elusimicrobiota bacterium]
MAVRRLALILPLLALLFLPCRLHADGMMLIRSPIEGIDPHGWDYFDESAQEAHITYEEGVETLLIRVGTVKGNPRDVAWIFPVPAEPTGVEVDVVTDFPYTRGRDVAEGTRDMFKGASHQLRGFQFQVYFAQGAGMLGNLYFGWHLFEMGSMVDGDDGGTYGTADEPPIAPDVVVHEHIEKEGVISEVITARTAGALSKYLKGRGINVKEDSIPVLGRYVGRENSFIVSWLKSSKGGGMRRGISVSFPTDRLFFPLHPTSVYGDKVIPITIRVKGYVTPELSDGIKDLAKVGYYLDSNWGDVPDERYTKIEIQAPASRLTEDLWMEARAPLSARYHTLLVSHPEVVLVIISVLASLAAGFLVGWFVFPEWRSGPGRLKLAGVSLANCFTIFGLIAATAWIKTLETDPEELKAIESKKAEGRWWRAFAGKMMLGKADRRKLIFI